jgi:hypothetical protein
MIPRYTRPEMAQIWAPDNKFRIMLEVETLAAEAMEQTGIIPQGVAKALRERGQFNVERIDEIEREVKHDVIAFLTNVTEYVGEEARYMHQGMTSSDVLDTTFAVQLQQSSDLLLAGIEKVLAALGKQSRAHQDTICIGRSHGIHAEPHHVRDQISRALRCLCPRPCPLACCSCGNFCLRHLWRGWNLCHSFPRCGILCCFPTQPRSRDRINTGHSARPSRYVFCDAWCHCVFD